MFKSSKFKILTINDIKKIKEFSNKKKIIFKNRIIAGFLNEKKELIVLVVFDKRRQKLIYSKIKEEYKNLYFEKKIKEFIKEIKNPFNEAKI